MELEGPARPRRAMRRAVALSATVSAACLLWQSTAAAQQAAASQSGESATLQEVVVTAQRRTESAQTVPIAVSVVSAANVAAMGLTDTNSLNGKIPTLSIGESGSQVYFLRGIGTTGTSNNIEQSVASYLDGVYLYSTWTAAVPLAGVDHVEILKGPQGTLFGRNTTGGVIQTVTRNPMAKPSLEATVGYGNYDTVTSTLYASDTYADRAGLSVAINYSDQGKGYGYNITRHEDSMWTKDFSTMVKGVVLPTADSKITALFWFDEFHSSGLNAQVLPGTPGADGVVNHRDLYTFVGDGPDRLTYRSYLGYIRGDLKMGELNLVSISAYRWVNDDYLLDQDTTAIDVNNSHLVLPTYNWSQEFQIQSPQEKQFYWMLGLYYFHGYAAYDPIVLHGPGFNAPGFPGGQLEYWRAQKTDSYAGFAQATYKVTPSTRITGGLRYTDETEHRMPGVITAYGALASPPLPVLPAADQDSSGWTGRFVLDHDFRPGVMGYFSYNHGLKSGGFSLVTANLKVPSFNPEELDAYEVGLKSEWYQHRLRVNAAFYWYDFSNIQVTTVTTGGNAVFNAAAAQFKGFDLDFDAKPTRNLTLTGAIGWLDGSYTSFPNAVFYYLPSQYTNCLPLPAKPPVGGACTAIQSATGKNTVYSPPFSGSFGATYAIPTEFGEFHLNGFYAYVDKQYVSADNHVPLPQHSTLNGYVSWQSPNHEFTVTLWGDNLLNEHKYANFIESTVGFLGVPENPLTYGVTLGAKFF